MGKILRLDNHCVSRAWQFFQIPVYPGSNDYSTIFRFINLYPVRFYFCRPRLFAIGNSGRGRLPSLPEASLEPEDFFPIGIFGSDLDDLRIIKKAGFNTVIIDPDKEGLKYVSKLGLRAVISINEKHRAQDIIPLFSEDPAILSWFVADEPETRSVMPELLRERVDDIMSHDPHHPCCMSIVRPRFVKSFKDSCHIFMLDQYPIPHQPITWLSDSLDEAGKEVGNERVWAVIQAFGGDEFTHKGWPRFPSLEELRSLSYLALIHNATGLFFYSYHCAHSTKKRWGKIQQVVHELNSLEKWLRHPPEKNSLTLSIFSPFKADAKGRAALHFQYKIIKTEGLLIMVNTIDKEIDMSLDGLPRHIKRADVLFEGRVIALKNGNIRDIFAPHQTHIYKFNGLIPKNAFEIVVRQ